MWDLLFFAKHLFVAAIWWLLLKKRGGRNLSSGIAGWFTPSHLQKGVHTAMAWPAFRAAGPFACARSICSPAAALKLAWNCSCNDLGLRIHRWPRTSLDAFNRAGSTIITLCVAIRDSCRALGCPKEGSCDLSPLP